MSIVHRICFVMAFFLFLPWQMLAAERIDRMDVQLDLKPDRSLTVQETIRYDFGAQWRHGIFRIIPDIYYRQGTKYRLHLEVKDVSMDGQPVPWKQDRAPGGLEIRIGDPAVTINGMHTYVVTYTTRRAVNSFTEGDEVYWNVTGDAWTVPIQSAHLRFIAPTSSTKLACFAGVYGTTTTDCQITTSGSLVSASTTRALHPQEGLTVVIQLPPGTVEPIRTVERLTQMIIDNIWLLLPVFVAMLMFAIWWVWGREPKGRGVIIAHYEHPRGLPPAILSSLIEQRMSQRAVTATILDLGRRGYLTVHYTPSVSFTKNQKDTSDLYSFEKILYEGLFRHDDRVTLASLKNNFWEPIERARKELFGELKKQRFFEHNPALVRVVWVCIALILVVIGFIGIGFQGWAFFGSLFVSAIIVLAFGSEMPRVTMAGAMIVEEAKGLKLFLSVTEKARLDFTDAPERTPKQFAEFLPAAVAFGVEEKWAKQFAGIDMPPPSYLQGNWKGTGAMVFANALTDVHRTATGYYTMQPSSAGSGRSGFSSSSSGFGGGSGGGFGGGGGGSW